LRGRLLRRGCCGHRRDLELFEQQLQLLDLALELLGAAPELQALQLLDDELQVFDFGTAREHQRL
jgi:hypothetical protein